MKDHLQAALKFIYALVEQFVFYFAAIVAFLYWVSFGNTYIAVSIFILICILFWALPSILKRKRKK